MNFFVDLPVRQFVASAPAPSVPYTKETTNFARLCRLLLDVGSQALRDTFDRIHPPAVLHRVLASGSPAYGTLQLLRKKRIMNSIQWGKLYPAVPTSVSSANFDITLLVVLLRNICHLTPPVTGWDTLPSAADTSTEANIARFKYYRNTVYGCASQASVDDTTFNMLWQDISQALIALGGASYRAAINKLKNERMDPDAVEDMGGMFEFSVKTDRKKTFGAKNCSDHSLLQVVGHMISLVNCRKLKHEPSYVSHWQTLPPGYF